MPLPIHFAPCTSPVLGTHGLAKNGGGLVGPGDPEGCINSGGQGSLCGRAVDSDFGQVFLGQGSYMAFRWLRDERLKLGSARWRAQAGGESSHRRSRAPMRHNGPRSWHEGSSHHFRDSGSRMRESGHYPVHGEPLSRHGGVPPPAQDCCCWRGRSQRRAHDRSPNWRAGVPRR